MNKDKRWNMHARANYSGTDYNRKIASAAATDVNRWSIMISNRCPTTNGRHLGYWNWTICKSEFPCHPDDSHQVVTQSDLQFGWRCGLKNFKMAAMVAIFNIGTEQFLQFWICITPQCLPSSLSSIRLSVRQQMWFEDFQDGCHVGHLGYHNGTILAILNLQVAQMSSTKFRLHLTYSLGADNKWRLSRRPPWRVHHGYDPDGDAENVKSYC